MGKDDNNEGEEVECGGPSKKHGQKGGSGMAKVVTTKHKAGRKGRKDNDNEEDSHEETSSDGSFEV